MACALCGEGLAAPVARPAPKFIGGEPDQAEGRAVLAQFRNVGIQGDYWVSFELRVLPRKGTERQLLGEMAGAPGPAGPLTRVRIDDLANPGAGGRQAFLLQGGPKAAAWTWSAAADNGLPTSVAAEQALQPIHGTDLTMFDLQMPFLQWTDFVYEGVANVRGRPAHAFLLYPPAGFPATGPAAVRVFLDTQFSAMTQAEWVGGDGQAIKTVTVLDLKKVGEQWLVKSIDLRNHRSRDKTRLTLTSAALGFPVPPEFFQPDHLSVDLPTVPKDRVQRL